MRSRELHDLVAELRTQLERLRAMSHGATACCKLEPLVQEVRRTAGEVAAWGSHLGDPCAIAASDEAHNVLARLSPLTVPRQGQFVKAGAVLCLEVDHPRSLDRNAVVQDLKRAMHAVIMREPPCRPVRFSVGLLPVDEDAFASWVRLTSGQHRDAALAPLLLSFLFVERIPTERLIGYIEEVSGGANLFDHLVWCGHVAGVVIPLTENAVTRIERRCLGPALAGDVRLA